MHIIVRSAIKRFNYIRNLKYPFGSEVSNFYIYSILFLQRETLKRTCIKSSPKVLVIQLKRFSYDWEANRALKFDDHFEVSGLYI